MMQFRTVWTGKGDPKLKHRQMGDALSKYGTEMFSGLVKYSNVHKYRQVKNFQAFTRLLNADRKARQQAPKRKKDSKDATGKFTARKRGGALAEDPIVELKEIQDCYCPSSSKTPPLVPLQFVSEAVVFKSNLTFAGKEDGFDIKDTLDLKST